MSSWFGCDDEAVPQSFNFCPKCGTKSHEGEPFCRSCGFGTSPQRGPESDVNPSDSADSEIRNQSQTETETAPAFSKSFDIAPLALEAAQVGIKMQVANATKGRKRRKRLSANFPDCDVRSIGLTPYGLAIMTCVLFLQEVSREPVKFMNHFGCEHESLTEHAIAAIQDQVFGDTPADVPSFRPVDAEVAVCEDDYELRVLGIDCSLSVSHHTPIDMLTHLMPLLRGEAVPIRHDSLHRVAAFNRYGMGCSEFHTALSKGGHVSEDQYLVNWFVGSLAYWGQMIDTGFGFSASLYRAGY